MNECGLLRALAASASIRRFRSSESLRLVAVTASSFRKVVIYYYPLTCRSNRSRLLNSVRIRPGLAGLRGTLRVAPCNSGSLLHARAAVGTLGGRVGHCLNPADGVVASASTDWFGSSIIHRETWAGLGRLGIRWDDLEVNSGAAWAGMGRADIPCNTAAEKT